MSAPTTTTTNANADDEEGEEPITPQQEEAVEPSSHYVIPSFLDILLDSDFRIQTKAPPLQVNETQNDRDYIDFLLEEYWLQSVSRSFLNQHQEDVGKEFTYGEVTSIGVRQLLEDMELLTLFQDDAPPPNAEEEEIVFYDLGSGEGKLVVQVFLETLSSTTNVNVHNCKDRMALQKIVGIELSPARHEMAVHSWNQLQNYLSKVEGNEDQDDQNDETLGDQNKNNDTTAIMDPHKMATAKKRLQTKLLVNESNKNIQLVHGDLIDYDFSDATHIYASSIFFPQSVLDEMSQKIMDYSKAHGKIKMVAALSDLELLEQAEAGWEKRVNRLQMSWGGANVRLYSPKDY